MQASKARAVWRFTRERFSGSRVRSRAAAAQVADAAARKRARVDDDRSRGNSTETPCRYCGNDGDPKERPSYHERSQTYQVVVACASCGTPFVALSRS